MEVIKNTEEVETTPETPVYKPGGRYTWDPNAEFVLSGREFGLWLNTIRGLVSTKEAIQIRMALECNDIIEELMAKGVASGSVLEVPPPKEE